MTDSNVITLNKLEQNDPLQEVLREGARKMLAAAIEAEIAIFIEQHSALQTDEGKAAVVRNGYLPQRPIQTELSLGVTVKQQGQHHLWRVRRTSATSIGLFYRTGV